VGGDEKPRLSDLESVYNAARPDSKGPDLPSSSLRGLLNLQRTNMELVPEAVNRMKEVAAPAAWGAFETEWKKLCGDDSADWNRLRLGAHFEKFIRRDRKSCYRSPLLDLLTLLAVRKKQPDLELPAENSNPARDAKT
jgi:hypothetical protein